MPTTTDPRLAAWQDILDRLELDVVGAEHVVAVHTETSASYEVWSAPEGCEPMPAELLPRARSLVARQHEAMQLLAEQLGVTTAHRAYADDAARSTRAAGPVYVDARY